MLHKALYLDSALEKYVEEAGASNFFCIQPDNTVHTPELSGTIYWLIIKTPFITKQLSRFNSSWSYPWKRHLTRQKEGFPRLREVWYMTVPTRHSITNRDGSQKTSNWRCDASEGSILYWNWRSDYASQKCYPRSWKGSCLVLVFSFDLERTWHVLIS